MREESTAQESKAQGVAAWCRALAEEEVCARENPDGSAALLVSGFNIATSCVIELARARREMLVAVLSSVLVHAHNHGFAAGRASVLGDTSEPLSEHGLCSCGALDPCEGGHDR